MNLTPQQCEILIALDKWNYLSVDMLGIALCYDKKEDSLRRAVNRLEDKNLLQSFCNKFDGRMYYRISESGCDYLNIEKFDMDPRLSMHDAYISRFILSLTNLVPVSNVEIMSSLNFNENLTYIPDARFCIEKGGKTTPVTLELELTQRNKTRIREKFAYVLDDESKYCFFAFPIQSIMYNYFRELNNCINTGMINNKVAEKVFFINCNFISRRNKDFFDSRTLTSRGEMSFREVFL